MSHNNVNCFIYVTTILVSLSVRFFNSFIWTQILKYQGANKVNYLELNQVFSIAALGRYVPGKITWIVGRVVFSSKHGISNTKSAVSSVFEGALKVIAGFMYSCRNYFFTPTVFNFGVIKAYKILEHKELPHTGFVTWKTIFKTFLLYTIALTINGSVIFFFIFSVYPELAFEYFLYVVGVGTVAASVGTLCGRIVVA